MSLQDASRRLQVPIEVIWNWIGEAKLPAEIRRDTGLGVEYCLTPDQLRKARELRDLDYSGAAAAPAHHQNADNVIAFDFGSEGHARRYSSTEPPPNDALDQSDALVAMENLRAEALAAVRRQAERETTLMEMVRAVELVLVTTVRALDRAQDINESRLAAELESLRARLSNQVREREQEDLSLRDELAATKAELVSALKLMNPSLDIAGLESGLQAGTLAGHADPAQARASLRVQA